MEPRLHITDEQLAELADGGLPETGRALLEEHLRLCATCREAWDDVVRYRAIWEIEPAAFRAPAGMVAAALEVPRRAASADQPRLRGVEPHSRRPWWRSLAPAIAVAVVMVGALGSMAHWRPQWFGQANYGELLRPLQQAVEVASASGAIVIPGGEGSRGDTAVMFRAGQVDASETIRKALKDLTELYQDPSSPPDVAHWLISGYLATGQVEDARLFVSDARLRYPGDERFVILDALVAYRSRDMARAERLLQTALQRDPGNGAALINLGLVQYEQGQEDTARRTLEAVRDHFPGTPLEVRANNLLSELIGS